MFRVVCCFLPFALTNAALADESQATTTSLGRKIDGFILRDYRGKQHSLSDYAKSKLVVIAVTGTDCPLVKLYGPRLQQLAKKYESKNVAFLGLNANQQDSVTAVAAYARLHKITFPILKDPGNVLADKLRKNPVL